MQIIFLKEWDMEVIVSTYVDMSSNLKAESAVESPKGLELSTGNATK